MATTSASWRTVPRPGDRRPLGGFNLATTSASWRTGGRGTSSPSLVSLQFGHDVSVVENGRGRGTHGRRPGASIWPRRQRRGERFRSRRRPRVTWRFNLATTSASWRTHRVVASKRAVRQLQFGHDVSVVENGGGPGGRGDGHRRASIWPRRQRRGERASCPRRRRPRGRFNLATTSASWRTARNVGNPDTKGLLQFGHDVSVVENAPSGGMDGLTRTASIWPRRQRRGERRPGQSVPPAPRASIWPRRQRRGEHVAVVREELVVVASIWPRRQRRGERPGRGPGRRRLPGASIWPRRQRRGERGCRRRGRAWRAGFNLATTSASWRTVHAAAGPVGVRPLQFGHDVSVVEN